MASPLTKPRVTNSSMMSNLKVSKFTAPHHQVLWSQLNLYKSIPIAPILLLPIPKICCSVLKARLRESHTKSSANVGNIHPSKWIVKAVSDFKARLDYSYHNTRSLTVPA